MQPSEFQRQRLREKGGLPVDEILVGILTSTFSHGNHLAWETLVEEARLRADEMDPSDLHPAHLLTTLEIKIGAGPAFQRNAEEVLGRLVTQQAPVGPTRDVLTRLLEGVRKATTQGGSTT